MEGSGESSGIRSSAEYGSGSTVELDQRSSCGGSSSEIQQLIESAPAKDDSKGNLALTSFNYINSIIGSGVLGIPFALHSVGFGMGIILLIVIAAATDFSLCILVEAGVAAHVNSYQALIRTKFGFTGFFLLTVAQFIYPFIAMISYNIIIGDTITKVFRRLFNISHHYFFGNRIAVTFLVTIFITLPLSLFNAIVKLSMISFVSLTFTVCIMGFILVRSFTMTEWIEPTVGAYAFANYGFVQAIGVIAFAYMCHHNSFLLFESLENASQSRWNRVTHISIGISCLVMLTFGISGYVIFTGHSQGDVLENFCLNDDWANAARIIFALTIILTYPIECFVAKDVCFNSFLQQLENRHPYLLTLAIVLSAFLLSISTDCLNIVLQINGVLAAVPLAYILPAAAYLKICGGKCLSLKWMAAAALVVVGTVVAVVGIIEIIIDISNGVTCSSGDELPYCFKTYANTTTDYENTTVLQSFIAHH